MSTLSSAISRLLRSLNRLLAFVSPRVCPICGGGLLPQHLYICTLCAMDAPLTNFSLDAENLMSQRVKGLRPEIEIASALILYIQGSRWRDSIHRLKYMGQWRYCIHYGEWLGAVLRHSPHYREVDAVVSVPLHPLRQMSRGYNQSEYIAHGVARTLGVEHIRGALRRTRHNRRQVSLPREERWGNVEGLFEVRKRGRLAGRNILIVDDVFTTGATIMGCAESLLDSVEGCRVWIATIAVSKRELRL